MFLVHEDQAQALFFGTGLGLQLVARRVTQPRSFRRKPLLLGRLFRTSLTYAAAPRPAQKSCAMVTQLRSWRTFRCSASWPSCTGRPQQQAAWKALALNVFSRSLQALPGPSRSRLQPRGCEGQRLRSDLRPDPKRFDMRGFCTQNSRELWWFAKGDYDPALRKSLQHKFVASAFLLPPGTLRLGLNSLKVTARQVAPLRAPSRT